MNFIGIINAINRIVEKLGALVLSISGDSADYVCDISTNVATQSLANNTETKVQLNTKIFDPNSSWDQTNYRWICPVAGFYTVSFSVLWNAPNAVGRYNAFLKKNGAATRLLSADDDMNAAVAGQYPNCKATRIIYFEKGDYLELWAMQTSGVAKTIYGDTSTDWTLLSIAKLNRFAAPNTPTQNSAKFRVYHSTNQSLNNFTFTKIALDKKTFDPSGSFDIANYRWVCPVAGYYQVNANLFYNDPQVAADYQAIIYKNGVAYCKGIDDFTAATAGKYPNPQVSDIIYCEKNDYLELYGYHSAGVAKTLVADAGATWGRFSGHLLSS